MKDNNCKVCGQPLTQAGPIWICNNMDCPTNQKPIKTTS